MLSQVSSYSYLKEMSCLINSSSASSEVGVKGKGGENLESEKDVGSG